MTRIFAIVLAALSLSDQAVADESYAALNAGAVLVTVNEQPITKRDLEFELLWRRVPEEQQPSLRGRFADELIDRQLVRAFLEQRRVNVPVELLDRQVEQLRQLTGGADGELDEVVQRLGFTQQTLREHLALPLAWRIHLNRTVTDRKLEQFFAERREQFDGTRVRASQIVIAVPEGADDEAWRSAEQILQGVRREITNGNLEFAEAALRHSTSPSRENGGDLGVFTYHDELPASLAEVAFRLDPHELSQPVRSGFGVHLLTTTERIPGQLSLEDVRGQVLDQLSQQMWDDEVERLRGEADIEWRIDPELLK